MLRVLRVCVREGGRVRDYSLLNTTTTTMIYDK